jgi:hypothetical protein
VHRTITKAALLIFVAVLGLTGCVTVSPSSRSGAAGEEPQIVQAPADEALDHLMRRRSASPRAHRPTRAKAPPRPPSAPRRAAPYIPLPRLPALPLPVPDVRHVQPHGTALRQHEACTLRRDFGEWQSGGRHLSLC